MKNIIGIIALLLSASSTQATDRYPKSNSIDISHYHFYLEVNDSTDVIYGEASVSVTFKKRILFFNFKKSNCPVFKLHYLAPDGQFCSFCA